MDFKALAENLGLEQDEYAELVELFVETGKPQIIELRQAVREQDGESIRKIAHSLKGASGNMGLMEISQEARKIEEQSVSENFKAVGHSIKKMEKLIETLSVN
jgi:HPt (histidine-containing phosphotransfer) domain-containing protein